MNKLQHVQNCAARLVVKKRIPPGTLDETLKELHWLKVKFRSIYKILVIVFNCIHGNAPKEVAALLVANDSERLTKLKQIKCRGKYGSRAFSFVGPRLWNMLPRYVYETEDVDVFKKNLKTYLMKNGEEFLYHLRSQ